MDIVIIFNGLGNQMSQYAFYLQKKSICSSTRWIFDNKSAHHYGFELSKSFNIQYQQSFTDKFFKLAYILLIISESRLFILYNFLSFIGVRLIREDKNYNYNPKHLIHKKGLNFYWGGWHSEKYFFSVKKLILETFNFQINEKAQTKLYKIINKIQNDNIQSVSVHVRRGDYLILNDYYHFSDVCTLAYYKKAFKYIKSKMQDYHFFVFSDDLKWCRENFDTSNITYVDYNKDNDSWMDMYLMSLCKHHINANSSFSWWGAWLCKKTDKVIITPNEFIFGKITKDVYPENWIKI